MIVLCDSHCWLTVLLIAVVLITAFICLTIIIIKITKAYENKINKKYHSDCEHHKLAKEKAKSYESNESTYIVTVKKE